MTRRSLMVLAVFTCAALAGCTNGAAITTSEASSTSSTALKLPPVDESLSDSEAEFVTSLRLWSAEQAEATTVNIASDQEIAQFGNSLCAGVGTLVEGGAEERILDFYDTLGAEMEAQGFSTDSYLAMFTRAIFILCPEYREATVALLIEDN